MGKVEKMNDDLIRRSTVLRMVDNALRMSTDEKETEILMGVRAGIVGIQGVELSGESEKKND